jgi:hypothetical protein
MTLSNNVHSARIGLWMIIGYVANGGWSLEGLALFGQFVCLFYFISTCPVDIFFCYSLALDKSMQL